MTEASETGLNTQKYKLAATGAGVIICQQMNHCAFRALLAMRSSTVGSGFGITGGGFVENGEIFLKQKPGFIIETAAEAWRETNEENPGFEEIIPLDNFLNRVQSISTLHVRVDDENGVHGTNFYAITVTDAEWEAIAALGGSDEREGALIEAWCEFYGLTLRRQDPETGIRLADPNGAYLRGEFYHKHELRALGQIAWHVQHGRLWQPTV
jgi:hypothetical protein